jgi:acetylornithine deacetylase/succinyl-diaminopimelate desuccinylase-like protein
MNAAVDAGLLDKMVAIRRDLHRHPELSGAESRPASQICAVLTDLGIPFRNSLAGNGVVADIPGAPQSPCVALRADMDALPIREETNLEFASVHEGIMRACGHDGHTAMLLGAACLLAREKDLPVPVRLIFQPAEESGCGASGMIEARALDNVALIFGGHLDRHYAPGTIAISDGIMNASTDTFRIVIGQGGHAARPIVSREVNPAHPSVVTIGRFEAGDLAAIARAVQQVELFAGLNAEQVNRVAGACTIKSFAAGSQIFMEGDTDQQMYLLLEGEVAIHAAGRLTPIGSFHAGECLGDLALLTGPPVQQQLLGRPVSKRQRSPTETCQTLCAFDRTSAWSSAKTWLSAWVPG